MPWAGRGAGDRRGLVPGPRGRRGDRQRADRRGQSLGPPARDLPAQRSTSCRIPGEPRNGDVTYERRRGGRLQVVRPRGPRAAVRRSATACPTPPSRTTTSPSRARARAGGDGRGDQHRRRAPAPTWCRSTSRAAAGKPRAGSAASPRSFLAAGRAARRSRSTSIRACSPSGTPTAPAGPTPPEPTPSPSATARATSANRCSSSCRRATCRRTGGRRGR